MARRGPEWIGFDPTTLDAAARPASPSGACSMDAIPASVEPGGAHHENSTFTRFDVFRAWPNGPSTAPRSSRSSEPPTGCLNNPEVVDLGVHRTAATTSPAFGAAARVGDTPVHTRELLSAEQRILELAVRRARCAPSALPSVARGFLAPRPDPVRRAARSSPSPGDRERSLVDTLIAPAGSGKTSASIGLARPGRARRLPGHRRRPRRPGRRSSRTRRTSRHERSPNSSRTSTRGTERARPPDGGRHRRSRHGRHASPRPDLRRRPPGGGAAHARRRPPPAASRSKQAASCTAWRSGSQRSS